MKLNTLYMYYERISTCFILLLHFLKVLGGIFPIAQVREPYSTVGYLAERLNLPTLLRIKPLDEDVEDNSYKWSAMDICEGGSVFYKHFIIDY